MHLLLSVLIHFKLYLLMAAKGLMCSGHSILLQYCRNIALCIKICSPQFSRTCIWVCFGRTCIDSGCMAKCMYQYGELKIFLHICYLKHKIGFCRCVVNGLSPLANMALVRYCFYTCNSGWLLSWRINQHCWLFVVSTILEIIVNNIILLLSSSIYYQTLENL